MEQGGIVALRVLVDQVLRIDAHGNHIVAAAVGGDTARLGDAHHRAFGQALQVAGVQRGVGEDHHHTGTVGAHQIVGILYALFITVLAQALPDRDTVDLEDATVIGLHQDADRIAAQIGRQHARGSTDTAFPTEADRARTGADTAFFHRTALGAEDGFHHIVGLDMAAADVVEPAVVGFTDNGVDTAHIFIARLIERVVQDAFDALGYRQGICQYDRGFDVAKFLDLRHAGELAETISGKNGGRTFLAEDIAVVRHDGRDAGADVVAFNDRNLADLDARDVGDGIVGSRFENPRLDAEITDAAASCRLGKDTDAKRHQSKRKA